MKVAIMKLAVLLLFDVAAADAAATSRRWLCCRCLLCWDSGGSTAARREAPRAVRHTERGGSEGRARRHGGGGSGDRARDGAWHRLLAQGLAAARAQSRQQQAACVAFPSAILASAVIATTPSAVWAIVQPSTAVMILSPSATCWICSSYCCAIALSPNSVLA